MNRRLKYLASTLTLVLAFAVMPASAGPIDLTNISPATLVPPTGLCHVPLKVIPVPNLSGVDLDFGFDTNGVPLSVAAVFPFAHNETTTTRARRPPTTTS